MRMLLTGCTGWLGQSIVPYFQKRYDCDVFKHEDRVFGDCRSMLFEHQYDYIIHGAPEGAENILKQAGDARILFLSSGAAHHRGGEYADAKRRDEDVLSGRAVIARLFTFIGPRMPQHYAAGEFLANLRDHRPIRIKGDGRTVRSYMHVDDLPLALSRMLDLPPGTVQDVGSPERVTILELAHRIATFGPLNVYTAPELVSPVDCYVPDTEYVCTDLATAIRRSIS